MRDSLITIVSHLPAALRETLTWDQGTEMAEHQTLERRGSVAAWQRGSNENTNGLLRQYFPRGVDLSLINVS